MMRTFHFNNFAEAYDDLVWSLLAVAKENMASDKISKSRGLGHHELNDVSIQISDPVNAIGYENPVRPFPSKYLKKELLWYYKGSNLLEDIKDASRVWERIANEDGTVNSSYGYLLFNDKNEHGLTQWDWAIESLKKDKGSRQAIIHFNKPTHQWYGNKDFPCTIYGALRIIDNKISLTISQRSCDIKTGYTFDVPFFMSLIHLAHLNLIETYPDLELGYFNHFINSLHLYETDRKLMTDASKKGFMPFSLMPKMEQDIRTLIHNPNLETNDPLYNFIHNK